MKESSEVPGETRGAGITALAGHLFNAQMEIGEKRLSFFQATLSKAEVEGLARLLPEKVLKARPAEAHLRGNLRGGQTLRAITLNDLNSLENSGIHGSVILRKRRSAQKPFARS